MPCKPGLQARRKIVSPSPSLKSSTASTDGKTVAGTAARATARKGGNANARSSPLPEPAVRALPPPPAALRLHRDAQARRQDRGLHPRPAPRCDALAEGQAALRLSLAVPAPVQGGGLGLSARGDRAGAQIWRHLARWRAALRLS